MLVLLVDFGPASIIGGARQVVLAGFFRESERFMGLLGTIIGGGLGFMLGGPLGAIIGGAIGSNFGEGGPRVHPGARVGGGQYYGGPGAGPRTFNPLEAQQTFMIAMISLAAKVAKADGSVTRAEVRSFDQFLKDQLGMAAEERRVAARIFNEARDSHIPAEEFARQIRQLMGHQRARLKDLISLLMSVAIADGQLHQAEERLIRSIAREMGLTDRDYEEATAMFSPRASVSQSYTVLGVTQSATDDEIKKAYRKLAREYHPDVVANKGMGEDFQKFAAEKMRAVNAAYDSIREARGF
jgi:DnaJ like chaperone protein